MWRDWRTIGLPFAAVLIGTALGRLLVGLARAPVAPQPPRPPVVAESAEPVPPPEAPAEPRPSKIEITIVNPPATAEPVPFVPPVGWRPVPDSTLLAQVALPTATPIEINEPDLVSRIRPEYYGHIALDWSGLRLRFEGHSMLYVHPAMESVALESVALALAEPAPSGFRLVREGPPAEFSSSANPQFMAGGQPLNHMSGTELSIPGVTVYDLVGRWPVIVHRIRLQNPRDYEQERMEILSHGSIRAFEPLVTPRPWLNH
jgi:hypothetical protein